MLSFKNSSILVILLLITAVVLDQSWWVHVVILVGYLALLVWGSIRIDSQYYIQTVCNGSGKKPQIAISFDDGPLPQYTPSILATLEREKVPACFFCIGKNIKVNPELTKEIVKQGHIIGNHSFSHDVMFDLYSSSRMQRELEETNELIFKATGKSVRFFRPPYGVTNPNLAGAIKKTGMTTIGWNIRSLDTVAKDENILLEKLWKQVRPGAIVLFHDTMAITDRILCRFITGVKEKGFEIVPIDELINENAYA
jgi:peptidoglycan/xylan/chitin deacetylase (PgdA/CDA1 family)